MARFSCARKCRASRTSPRDLQIGTNVSKIPDGDYPRTSSFGFVLALIAVTSVATWWAGDDRGVLSLTERTTGTAHHPGVRTRAARDGSLVRMPDLPPEFVEHKQVAHHEYQSQKGEVLRRWRAVHTYRMYE
jgi:hypothetical protein